MNGIQVIEVDWSAPKNVRAVATTRTKLPEQLPEDTQVRAKLQLPELQLPEDTQVLKLPEDTQVRLRVLATALSVDTQVLLRVLATGQKSA